MRTQTITQYVADDGRIFQDYAKCLAHEQLVKRLTEATSVLPPRCHTIPTHGYIQHSTEQLNLALQRVWGIILDEYGDEYPEWRDMLPAQAHPGSLVGRVLYDSDSPIDVLAYRRFACCDFRTGREYQQPYFVQHPAEAPTEYIPPAAG
jgi:hypothetical protein